jgi:hypothetical protein
MQFFPTLSCFQFFKVSLHHLSFLIIGIRWRFLWRQVFITCSVLGLVRCTWLYESINCCWCSGKASREKWVHVVSSFSFFFPPDVLKQSSRNLLCSQRWLYPTNYYIWGLVTVLIVIIIVTLAVVLSVAQYKRTLPSKIRSIFVWDTVWAAVWPLHGQCMDSILSDQFLYMSSVIIMPLKSMSGWVDTRSVPQSMIILACFLLSIFPEFGHTAESGVLHGAW